MEKLQDTSNKIFTEKDSLYTLISIIILFVIHTLITLLLMALYEQV